MLTTYLKFLNHFSFAPNWRENYLKCMKLKKKKMRNDHEGSRRITRAQKARSTVSSFSLPPLPPITQPFNFRSLRWMASPISSVKKKNCFISLGFKDQRKRRCLISVVCKATSSHQHFKRKIKLVGQTFLPSHHYHQHRPNRSEKILAHGIFASLSLSHSVSNAQTGLKLPGKP